MDCSGGLMERRVEWMDCSGGLMERDCSGVSNRDGGLGCFWHSFKLISIWNHFREKGSSAYDKICFKNALRLNRYNF